MPRRRPSATSITRTAADDAFDRVTLHAFMFTITLTTAVALAYGPAVALHHIADVLSAAGNLSIDENAWQGVMAY